MGKKTIFWVVICILWMAGCGNHENTEKAAEMNPVVQEKNNQIEEAEYGDAAITFNEVIIKNDLTAEQIEDAKQAALVYYEGTVFSVNSIEYLEGELPYGDTEGSCNFTVNVSRDGVVQEPDRTISLQPEQDGWKVVNEGY